jgi:hypothetical protein
MRGIRLLAVTAAALALALVPAGAAWPPAATASAGAGALASHHPEPGDVDGDGVKDENDNCPTDRNGDQRNTDGLPDGGDACDPDMDEDGYFNDGRQPADNCPQVYNPTQSENPCNEDPDHDGRPTFQDNCFEVYNPDQANFDQRFQYGDDQGDACDPDDDGDGDFDTADNCPRYENPNQVDADGDGLGYGCDADDTPRSSSAGGPGSAADSKPPALAVSVARRQRLAAVEGGLVVRVRCSEACAVTATLAARKPRLPAAGSGSAQVERAASTYAFVRFSKAARRRLWRRASTRLTLRLEAVDRAGNRARAVRNVTLLR